MSELVSLDRLAAAAAVFDEANEVVWASRAARPGRRPAGLARSERAGVAVAALGVLRVFPSATHLLARWEQVEFMGGELALVPVAVTDGAGVVLDDGARGVEDLDGSVLVGEYEEGFEYGAPEVSVAFGLTNVVAGSGACRAFVEPVGRDLVRVDVVAAAGWDGR